jgi:hypothetical protein
MGLGTELVKHALATALEVNSRVASRAVIVTALNPWARLWWERFRFAVHRSASRSVSEGETADSKFALPRHFGLTRLGREFSPSPRQLRHHRDGQRRFYRDRAEGRPERLLGELLARFQVVGQLRPDFDSKVIAVTIL